MGVAGGFLLLGAGLVALMALAHKAGAAIGSPTAPRGGTPAGAPVGSGGSPLPGVTRWERSDQGVDASAAPGSPVRAMVSGTVSAIVPNWYAGQPAVYIDSPGLPGGATGIYYAEQIDPHVQVGQTVSAGEQIGTVAASGTGLEIGFSSGLRTLAQATSGYVEGQVTAAGELMRQFLKDSGVSGL